MYAFAFAEQLHKHFKLTVPFELRIIYPIITQTAVKIGVSGFAVVVLFKCTATVNLNITKETKITIE